MTDLNQVKLLVVDDDEDLRQVIVSIFIEEGSTTFEANGGFQALEILEKNKVDVVITDMRMANGSGDELIRRLKRHDELKSLPVIVVTGYSDVNKTEMLNLGASAVISKPFRILQLIQSVKDSLLNT